MRQVAGIANNFEPGVGHELLALAGLGYRRDKIPLAGDDQGRCLHVWQYGPPIPAKEGAGQHLWITLTGA